MATSENIVLGVAFTALAAIVLFRKRDETGEVAAENIAASAVVGLSQTPSNTQLEDVPAYVANQRYWFWPPLNNFLPTVTSGQEGQVVERPLDFARRWITGSASDGDGAIKS